MRQILLTILLCALLISGEGRAETLLLTADLHMTANAAALEPALNALGSALPAHDALLVLGDVTNNAHAAEHQGVRDALHGLGQTGHAVYTLPGNHDLANDFSAGTFAEYYRDYGWASAYRRDHASASYAVMTGGGTCLVMLDTNAMRSGGDTIPEGGVSEETLRWLGDLLSALAPGTPVVVCGHHPILPADQRARMANADKLAALLRRHGVRLYLCGHDHCFAAVQEDGLQQITVGQPQSYPGCAGLLTIDADAFRWRMLLLYDPDDPHWLAMSDEARQFRENLGREVLTGTVHEGDAEAVGWFSRCFDLFTQGALTDALCESLLAEPGAQKWREIETNTVVKRWLFALLEGHPQSVREITVLIGD